MDRGHQAARWLDWRWSLWMAGLLLVTWCLVHSPPQEMQPLTGLGAACQPRCLLLGPHGTLQGHLCSKVHSYVCYLELRPLVPIETKSLQSIWF